MEGQSIQNQYRGPFTEIINQQISKIYSQIEEAQGKEISKQQKQNVKVQQQKTIQRGKDSLIVSQKTIKEKPKQNNPQWNIFEEGGRQIYRWFDCSKEFSSIKKIFADYCQARKMDISQNTELFATARKRSYGSCKCIIKMWLSDENECTVYQIKLVNSEKMKAKIIMVEGNQSEFRKFAQQFLALLWSKDYIKPINNEAVQFFYEMNSKNVQNFCLHCNNLMSDKKWRAISNTQIEDTLALVKKQCNILKISLKNCSKVNQNLYNERKIQDLVFKNSGIIQIYNKRYESDHKEFLRKRSFILDNYSVNAIFQSLEIEEHYNQYKKRREVIKTEELPYNSSIKCLDQLKRMYSPSLILETMLIFQQRIRNSYNQYYMNRVKLSDMDDHLPITIFCILIMNPREVNLTAMVKLMLDYLKDQDDYECERKILTNFEASIQYIFKEWKCQKSVVQYRGVK